MEIQELAKTYPGRIKELESIFCNKTNIYIDYANVKPWATKLGWRIDLKRLKQFLDSFSTIQNIKIYKRLLDQKKTVVLFATARKVAWELNELQDQGLLIFDIQKIRNFICWKKELR